MSPVAYERIEHDTYQTEHSLRHRPLPWESRSLLVIDVRETQDPQGERGQVAVDGKRGAGEHPAWCSVADCFVTNEGVRVHQQAPTRWEDDTAELRCESQLLDPADDEHVYLELHLQCLRLRGNGFSWCVTLDAARRLRDQLTEHLDAVQ
jgi:hypothetical protein